MTRCGVIWPLWLPGLVCWSIASSPNVLSFGRTTRGWCVGPLHLAPMYLALVGLPGLVCWSITSSSNVLSFGRTTRAGVLVHYIQPQCT